MPEWRITRLGRQLALTFERDGKRRRYRLHTSDPGEAQRRAPTLFAELTRPEGRTVADLWKAYAAAKSGKAVLATMKYTWKAIGPHFGHREGEDVSQSECEAYIRLRRKAGRADGAIHTELGHLRTVLVWAQKNRLIAHAPEITRPNKPAAKSRYLTRTEFNQILNAASLPHVKLTMHLMLATAARISAILELTWDRVDFDRRLIYLADPGETVKRKGRATVPINKTLFAALREAKALAMTGYVVEWAGKRVKSVKRSIAKAAENAGLEEVTPHVFRHTAAVWMAEAGIPISEIAQYLGHSNPIITYRVYAKYSPTHLRNAAEALETGIYEVPTSSSNLETGTQNERDGR